MYRNQETVKSSGNYPDGIEEVELVQEVFSFAHVRQAGSLANLWASWVSGGAQVGPLVHEAPSEVYQIRSGRNHFPGNGFFKQHPRNVNTKISTYKTIR